MILTIAEELKMLRQDMIIFRDRLRKQQQEQLHSVGKKKIGIGKYNGQHPINGAALAFFILALVPVYQTPV